MKTIKDVFLNFHHALDELYNPCEAEAITLTVLTELTGLSHAKIKAFTDADLSAGIAEKMSAVLHDLKTGKPVQYVLGRTEFYALPFLVNPAVLIPRPETEELIAWVLSSISADNLTDRPLNILDVGTGSGCIAISLKKNLPAASLTGIDISTEALQTARQNAVLNNVGVEFKEADIFQIKDLDLKEGFNVIVSNPPYVTLEDKALMHKNVTEFEPYGALFVPRHDPLIFYKAIAEFALRNLKEESTLFLEINEKFGIQTVNLLKNKGFDRVALRKDMSGRDRMIMASVS